MRLLSVAVLDFRNIERARLEPSPRTTLLVGENGQGKTNLLEAIHLAATLKPLRPARLRDLIRFGAARSAVALSMEAPGGQRQVAVSLEPAGRIAYIDGKPLASGDRLEAYFEGLAAVSFSPDDLLVVKGGPDLRRRFLDRAAFNRWPAVLAEAREYARALRERNAALRSSTPDVEASFRGPLVRAGARILRRRRDLLAELAPRVERAYAEISGPGGARVQIAYRPAANVRLGGTEGDVAASLAEALAARTPRDRERGFTSAGPHMDDAIFSLDGHLARSFGSQGQQRALVLALKVAEIENLRSVLGRPPLLLLDDVSSELDPEKNRYLLEYLARLPGQAFLTGTDRRFLERATVADSAFYTVRAGAFARDY
jgi:DNA replication and repair protein RecF